MGGNVDTYGKLSNLAAIVAQTIACRRLLASGNGLEPLTVKEIETLTPAFKHGIEIAIDRYWLILTSAGDGLKSSGVAPGFARRRNRAS